MERGNRRYQSIQGIRRGAFWVDPIHGGSVPQPGSAADRVWRAPGGAPCPLARWAIGCCAGHRQWRRDNVFGFARLHRTHSRPGRWERQSIHGRPHGTGKHHSHLGRAQDAAGRLRARHHRALPELLEAHRRSARRGRGPSTSASSAPPAPTPIRCCWTRKTERVRRNGCVNALAPGDPVVNRSSQNPMISGSFLASPNDVILRPVRP